MRTGEQCGLCSRPPENNCCCFVTGLYMNNLCGTSELRYKAVLYKEPQQRWQTTGLEHKVHVCDVARRPEQMKNKSSDQTLRQQRDKHIYIYKYTVFTLINRVRFPDWNPVCLRYLHFTFISEQCILLPQYFQLQLCSVCPHTGNTVGYYSKMYERKKTLILTNN